MYKTCSIGARDTTLINKYPGDTQKSQMNEDENPVAAEHMGLSDIEKKFHQRISNILLKHKNMWNG